MKTILIALLLTALGLGAQIPPPPSPTRATNRDEALRRALRAATRNETNAPAAENAATPAPEPTTAASTNVVPSAPTAATNVAGSTALRAIPPRGSRPVPPGLTGTAPAATPTATTPPAAGPGAALPATTTATPSAPTTTPPPPAKTEPVPEEEIIKPGMIDFPSADLNLVLKIYAEMVNRTILRAQLPAAQVTLKTQTPLTKKEAIQALDAVLAMNGIAMINVGDKFVKAVPTAQANLEGAKPSQLHPGELAEMGQYVTHIVQTKFLKPSEVVPSLTPFQKMPNAVLPIDPSMILVLRDNTENVKRMLEMIERVDVAVQSEFVSEVIPIKFAKAEDIASALGSLSGGGGTTVGARPAGTPTTRPGTGYPPGTPGAIATPGTVGTPAGTPSSGASFSDRMQAIIRRASTPTGGGDFQIIGPNKIIADARSNSLLIFATRQDMDTIKDIIGKLDVVLAQVLIETIIMDVSLDSAWAVGVSAAQNPKQITPNATTAGGYNNSQSFFNFLNSVTTNGYPGNLTGTLPPGLSYFAKLNDSWQVALQAVAGDNRVNVIQKPRIQTSHATPASIFIGSTVPYVSSTYYGGGYAGGPSSSYQQLKVGIGLNVTPFINSDGLVLMKIDETIDEISGSTDITGVGAVPTTDSRTLSAEVAVRDRETIILGGFIRNSENKKKSGVPLLQDIPLLGALFSSQNSTKKRNELMVLMRPTVLKTPELAALQVEVEKKRLPGVRRAEWDVEEGERKAAEQAEKDSARGKGKPSSTAPPFNVEELKPFTDTPPKSP